MKKNSIKQLTMHNAQLTIIAALIMLTAWACTTDELATGGSPAPVSITANVAAVETRAPGDVKTAFYPGDKITLIDATYTATYTATLAGDGTWATTPALNLPTDGTVPTVTATTTGTDPLAATATTTDGTLTLTADPTTGEPVWNMTLNFRHTRAVVDVVVFDPQMNNITARMQSVELTIGGAGTTSTSPADIIVTPGTLTAVTVRVAEIDYKVTTGIDHTLAAGTRYTIAFICDPTKPTATITTNPTWSEGGSTTVPLGYDYVISDLKSLKAFMNDDKEKGMGRKAIQTANITWNDSETWTPVGTGTSAFTGVYNGNGYTITGLKIGVVGTGTSAYSGMFGYINGTNAVLTGIHLRNASIDNTGTEGCFAGLLVGDVGSAGATISLCSATGTINVTTENMLGGLVGRNYSHITRCYADVAISGGKPEETKYIGGLVGTADGLIVACGANANISFEDGNDQPLSIGGLVGNSNGNIYYCYATGNVSIAANPRSSCVGGLIGNKNVNTIQYSYSTVNATGPTGTSISTGTTGSLIGYSHTTTTITSCHATGTATSGKFVGNKDDNAVDVSNDPEARRDKIAIVSSSRVRTVQYTPATGYGALGAPPLNTIPEKIFVGTAVWAEGNTPDINYNYNGQ